MIEYPCAKINLGLNVVSKRTDGYHDLETVFYPIKLNDIIEINEIKGTPGGSGNTEACVLSINGINIDGETKDNLVVKAYCLLKECYPDLPQVSIELTKNIPLQAGLGGGSSDCAYTIMMLNKMFDLGISTHDMQALASKLGADCAFFINPVPSYATGIGECLTPISLDLSEYTICIVKPSLMISTKEAFANITPKRPDKCCKDIVFQPVETWKDELVNDFEKSIAKQYGEIEEIKNALYGMGAVYAAMSGSGSAVFGLFKNKPENLDTVFRKCFTAIL